MALNPSPQRQSVVTFPTPNVNDILFFETVDAERVGPDVPKYGSSHPDYKKWPNHRLVHIEAADDQTRYYRYYYAADQLEQDNDNWSYSEADIGGTKFDAVSRDYIIRRSEFSSTVPAMGDTMPDTPTGKFSGTHVLAERKQIPLNDKILNGLYVVEQRVYVKKVPLSRLDFDEFFKTTNETKQILYYGGEVVSEATVVIGGNTIQNPTIAQLEDNPDNAYVGSPANNTPYWGMNSGTIRTIQQLSDNWYAVTEQEVVKCPTGEIRSDLQTTSRESVTSGISGLSPSTTTQKLFSTYQTGFGINPSLVRNTSCWAHNLKGVTGFVAWNSRTVLGVAGKRLGGVAITPRHIYLAAHANYVVGDTVFFCSKNNEVYSRVIKGVKLNEQYITNTATFDYGVALLDKDLPPSIEVVKVLPKDGYQYFQTEEFASHEWQSPNNASEEVLVMTTDQDENAHIRKLNKLQFGTFDYDNPLSNIHREFQLNPASSPYDTWDEDMVLGDSGGVCCLVVGGECVLLGLLSGHPTNNADDPLGPFVSAPVNYKAINQLITDVDVAYAALTAADDNDDNVPAADKLDNYYSDGHQLQPIDLSFNYKSYRPEEQSQGVGCARLRYETVVNYAFPPILQDVQFDVWNLRSGGARTYPRVLYSKGSFRGPCKAVVDISWSTTQPVGLEAGEKPAPEPISIQNPLFTLSSPPTLHEAVNFTVSINSDETWNNTGAVYNKNATNVTTWEPHIISSEVKPFRGGWLMETVTVYPPS
jgi:hypothetical protein